MILRTITLLLLLAGCPLSAAASRPAALVGPAPAAASRLVQAAQPEETAAASAPDRTRRIHRTDTTPRPACRRERDAQWRSVGGGPLLLLPTRGELASAAASTYVLGAPVQFWSRAPSPPRGARSPPGA